MNSSKTFGLREQFLIKNRMKSCTDFLVKSELSVKRTLEELDVNRSSFYEWHRGIMMVTAAWRSGSLMDGGSGTRSRT